jgi:hypothetical protein
MAIRPRYLLLVFTLVSAACTTWKTDFRRQQAQGVRERGPVANLAGARCTDGHCRCRTSRDPAETSPPPPGKKRIEIRMSALGGQVTLDSPSAGHFEQSGLEEACFYVDLEISLIHDFHMDSQEAEHGRGVVPHVHLAEYGPTGPYWYDILDIECGSGERGCDLDHARAWGESWLSSRKRGRLEACGSMSVTGLKWGTSGGEDAQSGGMLRDFETTFSLEVRKFATQFPPGAPECQLKP